jgi:putative ABC transport system substrate-binding protein
MNQNATWKIGWLSPNPSPDAVLYGEFRQGLGEAGLIEGENVEIVLPGSGVGTSLIERVQYLIDRRVNVIVSSATPATQIARDATLKTGTPPIVMVAVGDPVGNNLISSLERPGGNITGLATLLPESSARRLELLRGVLPTVARVAILLNPENPTNEIDWRNTTAAETARGMQLQRLEVRSPEGLEGAFDAAVKAEAEGLIVFADPMFIIQRRRIASLAATHRLPAMYGLAEFVEAGGLMAYGPCFPVMYRRAATFVRKIYDGEKPENIPVEPPPEFELTFNRAVADALGAALPSIVRFRFRRRQEIP